MTYMKEGIRRFSSLLLYKILFFLLLFLLSLHTKSASLIQCNDHFDDDVHIQAIMDNNLDLAKCYIQKNPPMINYQDPSRGWSALHVASYKVGGGMF